MGMDETAARDFSYYTFKFDSCTNGRTTKRALGACARIKISNTPGKRFEQTPLEISRAMHCTSHFSGQQNRSSAISYSNRYKKYIKPRRFILHSREKEKGTMWRFWNEGSTRSRRRGILFRCRVYGTEQNRGGNEKGREESRTK